MRALLLLLLAVTVRGAAPQEPPANPLVHPWIMAVMAHRPGEVDQPLLDMAEKTPEIARILVSDLEKALRQEFRGSYLEARNDVRRRAALLHTDIALLLPRQAAAFKWKDAVPTRAPAGTGRAPAPVVPDSLVYSMDGQYIATEVESGHWPFASWLLAGIKPDPSADEFVRLWYRAVAATFLNEYLYGNTAFHLHRARAVLPHDPILLFYAAGMQEGLASPRIQNVQGTKPSYGYREMNGRMVGVGESGLMPERDLLELAGRYLREALKWGAPPEAALRLGRVMGRLGRDTDAAMVLEHLAPPASEVRLAYFRELFLGTEYAALGRVEEARASFARAAALCPTAQAPLIALSDACRRSGDRAGALDALHRLEALPQDGPSRTEPWWDYYRSYAADAGQQLAAVRAWTFAKEDR